MGNNPGVYTMLVIEVDAADAEPAEAVPSHAARTYDTPRHRGSPVLHRPAILRRRDAELGGHVHLLPHPAAAAAIQSLAEEDLVGVRAVHVGGVEER